MRKYITEFIGTFFLVLTIGMVVIGGKGDFAPLAIGSSLMVMIFAGGHISGGHYNPAVTLAVLLRGKISLIDAILYMMVQISGAVIASVAVTYLLNDKVRAIHQVLKGSSYPITVNGKKFNGVMPAQKNLSDEDVANVLSYVSHNFGNDGYTVTAAEVKAIRDTIK